MKSFSLIFLIGITLSSTFAEAFEKLEIEAHFMGVRYEAKLDERKYDMLAKLDFEDNPPVSLRVAQSIAKRSLIQKFPRDNWSFDGATLSKIHHYDERLWYWVIWYRSTAYDGEEWFGPDLRIPIAVTMDGEFVPYVKWDPTK